jgi:hypothetical protein
MKNPNNHAMYAIDKYWIQLQKRDIWYLLAPIIAIQREDYSDIEQKTTNYEYIMKDLDKPHLVKNIQNMQNMQNIQNIQNIQNMQNMQSIGMSYLHNR